MCTKRFTILPTQKKEERCRGIAIFSESRMNLRARSRRGVHEASKSVVSKATEVKPRVSTA